MVRVDNKNPWEKLTEGTDVPSWPKFMASESPARIALKMTKSILVSTHRVTFCSFHLTSHRPHVQLNTRVHCASVNLSRSPLEM